MKISVLTMFPKMFDSMNENPLVRRAVTANKLQFETVDIKEHVDGCYRKIDDSPCGGGRGMIMRVDALCKALDSTRNADSHIVMFSPKGKPFDQKKARELASYSNLVLVCGRYEGIDARFESYVDEQISIGDYILSGGETAALVVVDSIVRLLPEILRDGSSEDESFEETLLEYRQYTHPVEYNGMKVPNVLLSGNQHEISKFRRADAIMETAKYRPELLCRAFGQKNRIGVSGSQVLVSDDMVLKISRTDETSDREYRALVELQGKLGVPRILGFHRSEKSYLLMEKAKGRMLCDPYYMENPKRLLKTACAALETLRETDISEMELKSGPLQLLEMARRNTNRESSGNEVEDRERLLEWLEDNIPDFEPVLCHGDLSLPNVLATSKGEFCFLDLGLCGIGDRYWDIATLMRSIRNNADGIYSNGRKYFELDENEFFGILGIEPDMDRLRWYTLIEKLL